MSPLEESIKQAIALHQSGNLAGAISGYESILAQDDDQAHIHYLLGAALLKQKTPEAQTHLKKAIQLNPSHAPSACCLGHALRHSKDLEDAEGAYRLAINIDPEYTEAITSLAELLCEQTRTQEAFTLVKPLLAKDAPTLPALLVLVSIYSRTDKHEEALGLCRQLHEQKPEHDGVRIKLAELLIDSKHYDEAQSHFRAIYSRNENDPRVHAGLGKIFFHQKKYAWAAGAFETALKHDEDNLEYRLYAARALTSIKQFGNAYKHLEIYRDQGGEQDAVFLYFYGEGKRVRKETREAILNFQKAITLDPEYPNPYLGLGSVFRNQKKYKQSIQALDKALELRPDHFETLISLSMSYRDFKSEKKNEHMEKAYLYGKQALDQKPMDAGAQFNMANVFMDFGLPEISVKHYRIALDNDTDNPSSESSFCFNNNYLGDLDAQSLFKLHDKWGERYSRPLMNEGYTHKNTPDPNRKIRLGFSSPDFCVHPVAYFFMPVFETLDRDRFEIILFYNHYNGTPEDDFTKRFRTGADAFFDVFGKSPKETAQIMYEQNLDVLIDLAGHSCGHKLLAMSYKPAPVQMTWIGYPNTTGSPAIDYRLVDPITDPPEDQAINTEKLLYLPTGFNCYRPPYNIPQPAPEPPIVKNGYITFGSFNNNCKHNRHVLRHWAELLKAVPNAHIVFKDKHLTMERTRNYLMDNICAAGLEPERVRFIDFATTNVDHMNLYREFDIALDPIPYSGTTTSCDALMMGLPILTRKGDRHAARVTASLLHRLGMDDWVADSEEDMIELAKKKATDVEGLRQLRKGLRTRMLNSPLCNNKLVTGELQNAIVQAWKDWCAQQSA